MQGLVMKSGGRLKIVLLFVGFVIALNLYGSGVKNQLSTSPQGVIIPYVGISNKFVSFQI